MSIKVFEPVVGALRSEEAAMVVFNHAGSNVSQDTGRDAQAYADEFGLLVVAADRPGTTGIIPSSLLADKLSSSQGYIAEMTSVGKTIERQLDTLGISRTIITGRSAGGLAALALSCSEIISSQGYLFAAEPVACEKRSLDHGVKIYKESNRFQKKVANQNPGRYVLPEKPELSPIAKALRLLNIGPAFARDKYHNKNLWVSDAGIQYAGYIALEQPGIDTTIEFAETTFALDDQTYRDRLLPLNDFRNNFQVLRSAHSTHASYDNRRFMAGRMRPVIDRAIGSAG